jgi:hypothetical protein
MRWIKQAISVALVLFPALTFADDLGLVRLSLIDGDVQALVKDTTDWTAAVINLPLSEGDRLWVSDDSKAELQIEGGVYVRGDGNTALDILTINHDAAQFYLDQGHIYINNRRGGIGTVQVDTPLSSIRSYDNSIVMIDVSEIDGATDVSVLKGDVYAESRAGSTRVSAGNTLTIESENVAGIAPIGSPDEWERWNVDRDRRMTAWGESSRYLPDELHEYSSDFDDNGRWDYSADYGYVWAPTAVPAGWAPYSYGSWIWIRGSYVWIDYDPWGWVPCHYGRWIFIIGRGWCWVPPPAGAVYWGPGYVGWTVTPTYVAWVPLAPGEVYYGYGYYGPGSVNITTVNVNTVFVNRTYVNARFSNSVTVVQRKTFGTGRHERMQLKENPFLAAGKQRGQNRGIAPPKVRPQLPIVLVPREEHEEMRQRVPARERQRTETPAARPLTPAAPRIVRPERAERPAAIPPAAQPPVVRPERKEQTQRAVRPAPEQQLPPERVRKINPQEMKQERRLVKKRESSVFRPQQPENLPVKRSREPREIKRQQPPPQRQSGKQGEKQKQNRGEQKENPAQR